MLVAGEVPPSVEEVGGALSAEEDEEEEEVGGALYEDVERLLVPKESRILPNELSSAMRDAPKSSSPNPFSLLFILAEVAESMVGAA